MDARNGSFIIQVIVTGTRKTVSFDGDHYYVDLELAAHDSSEHIESIQIHAEVSRELFSQYKVEDTFNLWLQPEPIVFERVLEVSPEPVVFTIGGEQE